jgi:hypothetical protein
MIFIITRLPCQAQCHRLSRFGSSAEQESAWWSRFELWGGSVPASR